MTKCNFGARCTGAAEYRVTMKAVGKRPAFARDACEKCAGRIGRLTPEGPLINWPTRECSLYKIEELNINEDGNRKV